MAATPRSAPLTLRDHLREVLGNWKNLCGNLPMPMKAILLSLEKRGHPASKSAVANSLKRDKRFVRREWGMYGLRNGNGGKR